jgi:hypothetical protein
VYAALEWVLIALLLINGLLAYSIAITREPLQHGDAGASVDSHITWVWRTRRGQDGARYSYVERELRPDTGPEPESGC